ncbi:MAG TPA: hypothetical protein VFK05_26830 [Polyangiaceae bacterium]|nr:hypothetical protein [Polyangiaceae bacterium]
MSLAREHSIERGFCLGLAGLAGLAVCLGCSSSSAPETGAGGNAGAGAGGAAKGGASGSPDSSGGSPDSSGGTPGSSGAPAHGGQNGTCEIMECFVANTCLDKCGGSVVYVGCCACEPPSVNDFTCTGTH